MKRLGLFSILTCLAATPAQAADENGLNPRAFYTVTTTLNGKVYALTHVVPEGTAQEMIGTNASKEKVELQPFKEGNPAQEWLFHPAGAAPEPSYIIYSKLTLPGRPRPTGVMVVVKVNGEFSDPEDLGFHEKYNRVSVGINGGDRSTYWHAVKAKDGSFTLRSFYGVKEGLRPKGDGYGWAEERVLEAVAFKGGAPLLRHVPVGDRPGQKWTLTKTTFLP